MKAVVCPVCNGEGQLCVGIVPSSSTVPVTKPCHGCDGDGWVVIPDEEKQCLGSFSTLCWNDWNK